MVLKLAKHEPNLQTWTMNCWTKSYPENLHNPQKRIIQCPC
ncbi:hypothetical protein HMPREF3156_02267 [Neisseria sp. HMSC06F02]|nr:hypothetical protein HMPREF3156_02267 [Neisseria sp. HMSC06F02]